MNIQEFISKYRNHPILFVGTGMSLRYLQKSYTWDGLLEKISLDLTGNIEDYYDIKASSRVDGNFRYELIATQLEKEFNEKLANNRNGPFEFINDVFYEGMGNKIYISRNMSTSFEPLFY